MWFVRCMRAKFEDEITQDLKHTGAGILSMANAGPNTNGSQFFITLAPCHSLDVYLLFFSSVSLPVESMSTNADGGPPEVTLDTSMGPITIEMYNKHAPKTCRNFVELSRRGYYDNVKFHRIIKDIIVQGGDPTGTGRGGESIYGEKFEDEITRDLKHTGAGILSMANAGPNTNGSQSFITLAPCQSLDGKHTIFGRVWRGIEIVKRLGSVQTDKNDRPIHDVRILRTIVKD